jgi:hypothetical protein
LAADFRRGFFVSAILLGLGGCTIAHVSITFAKLDTTKRGRFDA